MGNWFFATGDSVGVGFTKATIGDPPSTYVTAIVLSDMGGTPVPNDLAPDLGAPPALYVLSDAWWITESPIVGDVRSSAPQEINLHIDLPSLVPGDYYVWLGINTNDRTVASRVVPVVCHVRPMGVDEAPKPVELSLGDAVPNPFNAACRLKFSTPGGNLELSVFDILGRKVKTMFSGELTSGYYSAIFDGQDASGKTLPTGAYLIRIKTESKEIVRKALLVK
jgi:hypothetical protein